MKTTPEQRRALLDRTYGSVTADLCDKLIEHVHQLQADHFNDHMDSMDDSGEVCPICEQHLSNLRLAEAAEKGAA